MPKDTKARRLIRKAGAEVRDNPPAVLRKKSGQARERQRRAIILSKARAAGARIPKP